jgi:hypothetical protein
MLQATSLAPSIEELALVCRSAVGNGDFGLGGCMNLSSATTAYDGLWEYVGTRGTWRQLAS